MQDLEKEYTKTKKEWLDTIKNNISYFILEEKNPFREVQNISYFTRVLKQINDLKALDSDLIKIRYIDEDSVKVELVEE